MIKLDYTKKDYGALLEETKIALRAAYPEWTDFLDSDLGFAVVKAAVAVADVNHFYLDRQAAEVYLDTAEERGNVIALAKALGYTPRRLTPARVLVQFQLRAPYFENVVIPQYTSLTIEGKEFITEQEVAILAGSLSATAQCVQGSYYSVVSAGTGAPFYKINVPLSLAEVEVEVGGAIWEETPSFLNKAVDPNRYRLYEDRGRQVVMFGSILYTVPPAQTPITVSGIQTLGAAGNTRYTTAAVKLNSPVYNSLSVDISNLLGASTLGAAVGGSDAETTASIKKLAPGVYSTQQRAVTAADYKYLTLSTPGVTEAEAWGGELIGRYGEVHVSIASTVDGSELDTLIALVQAKLETYKALSIQVVVRAAEDVQLLLSFSGAVHPQFGLSGLNSVVADAVQEYFDTLSIGEEFQFSDLINHLSKVTQLDHYMLNHRVRLSGIVSSGEFLANAVQNPLYTAAVLKDSLGEVVWEYADGGLETRGLKVAVSGLSADNGVYYLEFDNDSVNCEVQPFHKIRLGQIDINLGR